MPDSSHTSPAHARALVLALVAAALVLVMSPARAHADTLSLGTPTVAADPGVAGSTSADLAVTGSGTYNTVQLAVVSTSPQWGSATWVEIDGSANDITGPGDVPFTIVVTPPATAPGGTYTFQIASLVDGHQSASSTLTLEVSGPGPIVYVPRLTGHWDGPTFHGALTISGRAIAASSVQFVLLQGSHVVLRRSASVSDRIALSFELPKTLRPGKYVFRAHASAPAGLPDSQAIVDLQTPASGILSRRYASASERGPQVEALQSASQLWAHFIFSQTPAPRSAITTQWILPSGRALAPIVRPRTGLVEAEAQDLAGGSLPPGVWRCVLRVRGTIFASVTVRVG